MNQIEAYVKIYSACFNDSIEAKNDAIETIIKITGLTKEEIEKIKNK